MTDQRSVRRRVLADQGPGTGTAARRSQGRLVLVVDDDQWIRECVEAALTDEGYEVTLAANGAEALVYLDTLWRAERRQPHLILLDMRMPVMDGWSFAGAYRQRAYPHAPVVVLTAARDAGQRAVQVRADGVLAKPFDLDELLALVERSVHQHVA